jgi:hypothetical protein
MRKLGISGLVVVMAASLGIVSGMSIAGAGQENVNALLGERRCTVDYNEADQPVETCTVDELTLHGEPITSLAGANLYTEVVRTCSQRGAGGYPSTQISDGYYYLRGGTGVFAGVYAAGHWSMSSVLNFFSVSYGTATRCSPTPLGDPIVPEPPPPPFEIAAQSLPDGTVGHPYSTALSASNGSQPYRWRVINQQGRLPRGLKINKSTGAIAGVPKKLTGTFSFTVEAKDSHRPKWKTTRRFSITVH